MFEQLASEIRALHNSQKVYRAALVDINKEKQSILDILNKMEVNISQLEFKLLKLIKGN